jgi:hypothetical protein
LPNALFDALLLPWHLEAAGAVDDAELQAMCRAPAEELHQITLRVEPAQKEHRQLRWQQVRAHHCCAAVASEGFVLP